MEQPLLLIFCFTWFIIYIGFLVFATISWTKYTSLTYSTDSLPTVSVIISARNEETNLPILFKSLSEITYPKALWEIILINDQSTDGTAVILKDLSKHYDLTIKFLTTSGTSITPKKQALNLGIQSSQAEILLFTDADCQVPGKWIQSMCSSFQNKRISLVFGPINYSSGSLLEKFLSIEQAALLGSAIASLRLGIPSMCNGANLAVRRTAFDKVNGFETQSLAASGDDELLLHKIYKSDPESVGFIKSQDAIVSTCPVETMGQLFNQRKRWAGKWEKYLLKRTKAFALSIFGFHFAWILFLTLTLFQTNLIPFVIILFILKSISEYVFISKVLKFLGKRINLPAFVLLELIYSFYVVFFGLVSRGTKYNWKDRKLN